MTPYSMHIQWLTISDLPEEREATIFSSTDRQTEQRLTQLTDLLFPDSVVFQFLGSLHHELCCPRILETPAHKITQNLSFTASAQHFSITTST